MTPEETIIQEVKKAIDEKGFQTKAEAETAIKSALEKYTSEQLKTVQDELQAVKEAAVKQGEELEKLKKMESKPMSVKQVIEAAMPEIQKAIDTKRSHKLVLTKEHLASIINKTAAARTSITSDIPGMLIPEIGRVATGRLRMAEICSNWPVSANSHGVIGYWDQTTATRNADNKAENAQAPESAIAWEFYSKSIDKIFDSIPFTKETMDITWMMAEIENFINTNLLIKENNQILLGNGTSPQLYGLYTNATEFDYATFGHKIRSAQWYDLIRAIQTDIQKGKDNNFIVNYAVMNDSDLLAMTSEKNADGDYITPPFVKVNPDGTVNVGGVLCIPQSDMTENTLIVGDFTKARRYNMEGVELEIGYNGNDIVYDRQTLVGRIRESIIVRNVDTGAFRKCSDVAAAIAGISIITA